MVNPNVYIFDPINFAKQLTPPEWRQPKFTAILNAFITPFKLLYDAFALYREDAIYRITHTSSLIHIEKVLNDEHDNDLRRIYLTHVDFEDYTWLYPAGEADLHLSNDEPVYLLEGEATRINPDGTVWIPVALEPVDDIDKKNFEAKIRSLVDYYADYGITYNINYYE